MDTNLYVEAALGYEESWHLQTNESLKMLKELLESSGESTVLAKYRPNLGRPNFIHFAGHNENVLALMRSFDQELYTRVAPGSAIWLDIHSPQKCKLFMTYFCDKT